MNRSVFISLALLIACGEVSKMQFDNPPTIQERETPIYITHQLPDQNNCPTDMVRINSFCMDRYEYPNVKGQYPDFAMSAYDAERVCSDINKRLCTYEEWHRACVGSHNYHYSYASVYKRGVCNDDKGNYIQPKWELMFSPAWKPYARTLYKGEPSGNRPGCITDEGVYDLPANVREWVIDTKTHQYVIPSGYWYQTMEGPETCDYVIRNHSAGFASYEFGTRCCKSIEE